jgi:hypothetical protein
MTWFPLVSRGWVGSRVITGADTIVLEDAGGKIYSNVASGHAVTIPLNATVTYTGLDVITWIQQGAGSFTVTPVSGSVTLIPPSGKTLVSKGVGAIVQATPRTGALDTWNVYGDLA